MYQALKPFVNPVTGELQLPQALPAGGGFNREKLVKMFRSIGKPYIEGAFMTKHNGKYYLQYASPATQFNTYCDGVYVADAPLGPFTLQQSNPFSSKPGGFMQGAGHGSTIQDADGNFWHASTMRVSVNHDMERRVGLFPAGVDADGVLFCNQNFADYPLCIPDGKFDPWSVRPACMLLSYQKPTAASSTAEGSAPALAVDENCRTWWSAADARPSQWLSVDLEKVCDIHAVQVNLRMRHCRWTTRRACTAIRAAARGISKRNRKSAAIRWKPARTAPPGSCCRRYPMRAAMPISRSRSVSGRVTFA